MMTDKKASSMDDTAVLRSTTLNAEALYQQLLAQVKQGLAEIASQMQSGTASIEIAGIYSGDCEFIPREVFA